MPGDTEFVPAWARHAVWYQIFPERFWNGDHTNDPTVAAQLDAEPYETAEPWEIHPWTADWYLLQPYEQAHAGKDFGWHALRRRYGGDLQGILDKLDYLQDLGVTALYLNPIFEAASSHKYDGASYHHVDPTFGPDPAGDRMAITAETFDDPATWVWTEADKLLVRLIAEVHRRGMRIILDGVFNHMGIGSPAFRDLVQNQQASRFRDWFKVTRWRDDTAGTTFDYTGWEGVRQLAELRQDDEGLVAGPQEYVFAATRRWMDPDGDGDPADGVDGWRLDVAYCVRHPFWKRWRAHVRSINPEAYTVAEVIRAPSICEPYLRGDEFDAVMNYNFGFATGAWLFEQRIDAAFFDAELRAVREAYPPEVAYVLQNMLDSHDTARLSTIASAGARMRYGDWPNSADQMRVASGIMDPTRPGAAAWQLVRLALLLQMTYVGAPMIYYGDEAGMWGANDPDCRKPMVWPDLEYDAELLLPNGARRVAPEPVAFDHDLHAWYKQLIALRRSSPALQVGDYATLLAEGDCFAFQRSHGKEQVIVALNRSRRALRMELEAQGRFVDALAPEAPEAHADTPPAALGHLSIALEPLSGVVLRRVG